MCICGAIMARMLKQAQDQQWSSVLPPRPPADPQGCVQNVALAIRALEVALQKPASSSSPPRWPLLQRLTSQKAARSPTPGCCLVVAGGYDQRLPENREVLAELQALVQQLGVQEHVSLPASLVTEKCKSCSGTQCCLSSACAGSACSNVAGPCLPVMVVPGQHRHRVLLRASHGVIGRVLQA